MLKEVARVSVWFVGVIVISLVEFILFVFDETLDCLDRVADWLEQVVDSMRGWIR